MARRRCRRTDQYVAVGILVFGLLTFVMYQVSIDQAAPLRLHHRSSDGLSDGTDKEDRSEVMHSQRRILKTSYGTVEVRDFLLSDSKQLVGRNLSSRVSSRFSEFDVRDNARQNAGNSQRVAELMKRMAELKSRKVSDSKPKVDAINREKTYSCKTRLCSELPNKDRPYFKYCFMKARLKAESPLSKCHFMNSSARRYPIALASHIGSDSTYIRGLLQAVTGYCTGAIYCSAKLRGSGFPGESIRSGAVLVVNTDQTEPRWSNVVYKEGDPLHGFKKAQDIPLFGSAVLLVRNPFHSLLVEWRFRRSENTDTNVEWSSFVLSEAEKWQRTVLGWLTENRGHPVLVLKYEQLLTDTAGELKRVLDFLRVPYSAQLLAKVEEVDYEVFGAQREVLDAVVEKEFSVDQMEFVKKVVADTSRTLKANGLDEECDLLEYL